MTVLVLPQTAFRLQGKGPRNLLLVPFALYLKSSTQGHTNPTAGTITLPLRWLKGSAGAALTHSVERLGEMIDGWRRGPEIAIC